jgi:hypothetical protein
LAQDLPDRMQFRVRLERAAFQSTTQPAEGSGFWAEIMREDGRWERAFLEGYNTSIHLGRVTKAAITPTTIKLGLDASFAADFWVPAARGRYTVTLERRPDDTLEGTYTGVFKGVTCSGRAWGMMSPPARPRPAGFVPFGPTEHPRLLFRKSDLPALRAKAGTAWGQAMLARMGGGPALGIKYQLTGEVKYAQQATGVIDAAIARGWHVGPHDHIGSTFEDVALTYDLCYDGWSPAQRNKAAKYMRASLDVVLNQKRLMGGMINWDVCSNLSAPTYGGAAMMAVALYGSKGPKPSPPLSPSEAERIAPADEYTPGPGVPVVPLVSGRSPNKWITIPPIPIAKDGEPIPALGTLEQLRPEVGTSFDLGERSYAFQPLEPRCVLPDGGINLEGLVKAEGSVVCAYTVIENDHPRSVKIVSPCTNTARTTFILNGNVLSTGRVVELGVGRYPLLMVGRFMMRWMAWQPMLVDASMDDLETSRDILARWQADYRQGYFDYEDDLAEWQARDGEDVQARRLYRGAMNMMARFARRALGRGGFQAEVSHYSPISNPYPLRYDAMHHVAFGEDITPEMDFEYLVPRHMFSTIIDAKGKAYAQEINGYPTHSLGEVAAAFVIAPEEWKPALLWEWNRMLGVKPDELPTSDGGDPEFMFAHYPLNMEPQPPGKLLPTTWEAPDFGFYAWRNGWKGPDDFLVQTFLKSQPIKGWNGPNAGTFRIHGLGQDWASGPASRERSRPEENVVQFPDDRDLNLFGCAQPTYLKMEKDGSGAITMDMSNLYDRLLPNGKLAAPDAKAITGLRAMAVDYSGKCGAPCLFAVVDRISNAKTRLWTWQAWHYATGDYHADKVSDLPNITTDATGFTLARGGATLRATFVTPTDGPPVAKERLYSYVHPHSGPITLPCPGVYAQGQDFFVVVTIGRGEVAPVKVDGTGLNAVATIGTRTVRFDGEKIVFGEAE